MTDERNEENDLEAQPQKDLPEEASSSSDEVNDGDTNNVPPQDSSTATASYFEKIVRHIPAAINAAYVASLGLLADAAPNPAWLHWSVFIILWILVPFYTLYIPGQIPDKSVSRRYCVLASTISFAVWVYAIDGGPIAISFPEFYQPLYGSLLLIITTLILPVLEIVLKKINYFKPEAELEI